MPAGRRSRLTRVEPSGERPSTRSRGGTHAVMRAAEAAKERRRSAGRRIVWCRWRGDRRGWLGPVDDARPAASRRRSRLFPSIGLGRRVLSPRPESSDLSHIRCTMLARAAIEPRAESAAGGRPEVPGSERGVRTFRDSENREWEVRAIQEQLTERRTRLLPRPELAGGWLLFTSGEERRRFGALPPGWTLANDALLCRWCEDAARVVPSEARPRATSTS